MIDPKKKKFLKLHNKITLPKEFKTCCFFNQLLLQSRFQLIPSLVVLLDILLILHQLREEFFSRFMDFKSFLFYFWVYHLR